MACAAADSYAILSRMLIVDIRLYIDETLSIASKRSTIACKALKVQPRIDGLWDSVSRIHIVDHTEFIQVIPDTRRSLSYQEVALDSE